MAEKTTKVKFSHTNQKKVDKFFKKDAKVEDNSSSDEEVDSEAGPEPESHFDGNHSDISSFYDLVEPIGTVVGPIGKFVLGDQTFPIHPAVAAFGKRRTGKSYSFRWWMYKCFRHIPFGVVFTNTTINGFWSKYVPDWLVFQGLPKHQMDVLVKRQKTAIAKWKKEHPKETAENSDAYKNAPELAAFCVFDDVISDRVAMQWNEVIASFFVEGRHLCISVFITSQHVKGIGPLLRGNMDVVLLQPIFQREARMVLADLYGGFMDRPDFLKLMNQVVRSENLEGSTPKNPKLYVRTMVVNDFENSPDPQLKFKWSEAENPDDIEPGWRLCDDKYWKVQDNRIAMGPAPEERDPVSQLNDITGGRFQK